jgi:ribonuclease HI
VFVRVFFPAAAPPIDWPVTVFPSFLHAGGLLWRYSFASFQERDGMTGNLKKVLVYTDGSCLGNPGPGGYGIVLMHEGRSKELSGGFCRTTNNRMEILAAIIALRALKVRCEVTLYSDSQYLINAVEKGWLKRWQAKGWIKSDKEPVVNPDLWKQLLEQLSRHHISFVWVRGHAGHRHNERCDELARTQATRSDLPPDPGY